jgi:hypothetical protein
VRGAARLTALALATLVAGCGPAEAPIPPRFEATVAGARASLADNWDRPEPPSFAFNQIRCRADGGLLVVFDQYQLGNRQGYAIALQGPGASGWGGGYGVADVGSDPEVRGFFSEQPEVSCGL